MTRKVETIILAVMCFILTIGICIQIKTVNNNGTTISGNQKQNDLKTQVLKMKEKYENQYAELERVEKELEKERENTTNNNSELADLESQIKKANLILGNTDVTGTGVRVTLTDGKTDSSTIDPSYFLVHAENILQVVNEMRNAGAEAISINGERIVNTTDIVDLDVEGPIKINSKYIRENNFEIKAIGNSSYLESSIFGKNGYAEQLDASGIKAEIERSNKVKISKYTGDFETKYIQEKESEKK
mgnify:CR=1 FL=1